MSRCRDCHATIRAPRVLCRACAVETVGEPVEADVTIRASAAVLRTVPPAEVQRRYAEFAGRYEELTAEQREAVDAGVADATIAVLSERETRKRARSEASSLLRSEALTARIARRRIADLTPSQKRAYWRASYHRNRKAV